MEIQKGDILVVMLNPAVGSEQSGTRPVVVIQNNIGNKYSPTTIIATITSQDKADLPTHVEIKDYKSCGLDKPSIILLEQICTIDKSRILKKINRVDEETMKKINKALRISLDIQD